MYRNLIFSYRTSCLHSHQRIHPDDQRSGELVIRRSFRGRFTNWSTLNGRYEPPSKPFQNQFQLCLIFPEDMYMHSRFLGYSMLIKSMAFIPCIFGFVIFFLILAVYGRISAAKSNAANKTIEV